MDTYKMPLGLLDKGIITAYKVEYDHTFAKVDLGEELSL